MKESRGPGTGNRPRALSARRRALAALHSEIQACTRCPLHRTRTQAVPGVGPVDALVMLVGEAPGRQEDLRGEPFVGAAGRFLDGLLESVGLTRDQVYITNVVKSRPFVGPRPGRNRPPAPGEIDACRSWLDEQIELVRPEIVVAMGRVALEYFFPKTMLSEVHGRPLRRDGRTVLPTLHPAVHRWPRWRAILVGDFKALGALLGTSVRDTAGRSGRKPPPQRRKEAPQPSQK